MKKVHTYLLGSPFFAYCRQKEKFSRKVKDSTELQQTDGAQKRSFQEKFSYLEAKTKCGSVSNVRTFNPGKESPSDTKGKIRLSPLLSVPFTEPVIWSDPESLQEISLSESP